MKQHTIMVIAGEPSGDALAADLARALQQVAAEERPGADLQFFGAGGAKMAEAGVEVVIDMTRYSVIGLLEVLRSYNTFRSIFNELKRLAFERKPDAIVLVDFGGFNRRFARAIRSALRRNPGTWTPRIVQYVSPQVWASRPGRAEKMARDIDLLLCLFPFEKDWYAQRVPQLRVEFVGHPIADRPRPVHSGTSAPEPLVLLLPGSREGELRRHLPVIVEALRQIAAQRPVRAGMVLPTESLARLARELTAHSQVPIRILQGGLAEALAEAEVAMASTGTVTLECAFHGVPTVALYRTSWSTYEIGRRLIRVPFLAMPNLLANERVFPEFIQHDATPENLARETLDLLERPERRRAVREKLQGIVDALGEPGASLRAARAVMDLLEPGRPRLVS